MMCSVTGRTSDVTLEKGHQGSRYVIDISPVRPVMDRLSITFDDKYCFSVLRKYYDRSPAQLSVVIPTYRANLPKLIEQLEHVLPQHFRLTKSSLSMTPV